MIVLRKMTSAEFEVFKIGSMENYVRDQRRATGADTEESLKMANDEIARLLPEGLSSKKNFLFCVEGADGQNMGYLWYAIRGTVGNERAFICDLYLKKEFRGKGYGRELMKRLEEHVRAQGLDQIGLHVFGFNKVAIELYQSMGFEITNLLMSKKLE